MLAMLVFEWIQISMGSAKIDSNLVLACAIVIPFPFYAALLWPVGRFVQQQKIKKVIIGCLIGRASMVIIGNVFANELMRVAPQFLLGVLAMIVVMKFVPDAATYLFAKLQRALIVPAVALFGVAGFMPPAFHTQEISTADAPTGAPNIVLLSWDTVRADVLSLYGGTGLDTPNLDKFATRSVVFDDAVANTPITGPEHSIMLTGVLPPSHGMRSNVTSRVPESVNTLPERLAANGYATGAFVSSYPMLGRLGLQQGFSVYNDRMNNQPLIRFKQLSPREVFWSGLLFPLLKSSPKAFTEGDIVQQRAVEWLDQRPQDRPYFLFLHLYDAHAPYEPLPEFKKVALERIDTATPKAFDPNDANAMARYRGEIAMLDNWLGSFLDVLDAHDPGLNNTLIVLTSDHGECFGEGGIHHNHVPSLYEATQHVPLVVHFPQHAGAGLRVAETVTHLDIMPTFLLAAQVDIEGEAQDVASYPLQLAYSKNGMGYSSRDVYLEAQQKTLADDRLRGWRTAANKFLLSEGGEQTLFEYRKNEVDNIIASKPSLGNELRTAMISFFDGLTKIDGNVDSLNEQDIKAMGELGYTE